MRKLITILLILFSFAASAQVIRANRYYVPVVTSCSYFGTDSIPFALYSFRNVAPCAYIGNCIRVRRSSDNTELNIGFASNFLDTAAIKSFIGSSDAFIVNWYDQSNSGHTATQSTAAAQPKLATAGVLIYANGKLAALFDGSNDILFVTFTTFPTVPNASIWGVSKRAGAGNGGALFMGGSASTGYFGPINFPTTFQTRADYNTTPFNSVSVGTTNANLQLNGFLVSYPSLTASDGVSTASITITGSAVGADLIGVGGIARGAFVYFNQYVSEGVVYTKNMAVQRTTIEANIKSYYGL